MQVGEQLAGLHIGGAPYKRSQRFALGTIMSPWKGGIEELTQPSVPGLTGSLDAVAADREALRAVSGLDADLGALLADAYIVPMSLAFRVRETVTPKGRPGLSYLPR